MLILILSSNFRKSLTLALFVWFCHVTHSLKWHSKQKEEILNRCLGTLTVEADLNSADYVSQMTSTGFSRANENKGFKKKKKQK